MHIDTYYKKFWVDAMQHFNDNKFVYDSLIDDPHDNRFGLSVLLRPDKQVLQQVGDMLDQLKLIEPNQYFYPNPELHVTILSVISCYNGFTLKSFNAADYNAVVIQSLQNIPPFKIHFQGITASPSCIMVQGYPDGTLNHFRQNLRKNFKSSGLEISYDARYTLMLAHSTVMRFKQKLKSPRRFIKQLQNYRQYEFGSSHIKQVELVFNDWYQRESRGKLLYKYELHD